MFRYEHTVNALIIQTFLYSAYILFGFFHLLYLRKINMTFMQYPGVSVFYWHQFQDSLVLAFSIRMTCSYQITSSFFRLYTIYLFCLNLVSFISFPWPIKYCEIRKMSVDKSVTYYLSYILWNAVKSKKTKLNF